MVALLNKEYNMKIERNPDMHDRGFLGEFYIVNVDTKLAIQSEQTLVRARKLCKSLNHHAVAMSIKNNTSLRVYKVIRGEFIQKGLL